MLGWRSCAQARLSRRKRCGLRTAHQRRPHHLDRDLVAKAEAAGAIDVAHAAGAEEHR